MVPIAMEKRVAPDKGVAARSVTDPKRLPDKTSEIPSCDSGWCQHSLKNTSQCIKTTRPVGTCVESRARRGKIGKIRKVIPVGKVQHTERRSRKTCLGSGFEAKLLLL